MHPTWTSLLSLFLSVLLCAPACPEQTATSSTPPPQRDSQALTTLSMALAAVAGATSIGSIQDFTGSGSITYFWAGQEVQGPATIRGRGTNDFRVDANLPGGTRSWVAGSGKGSLKDTDGSVSAIPSSNTLNLGALSFPQLKVASALNDSTLSIQSAGLTDLGGRQVYVIHVHQVFPQSADPGGLISHLTTMDFLIDTTTYQILLVRDNIHPAGRATQDIPHEMEFSDYRPANGCLVPFSITERVNGQRTWVIQLSAITFNTGLTDTDFQL